MSKQYETVIGLEGQQIVQRFAARGSRRTCNKDKNFLWMQYRIRGRTEYTYLPGMYRYAGLPSGIK